MPRPPHAAALLALCLVSTIAAHDDRTVGVGGTSMAVRTIGLSDAARRPVVVFESGAGTGLTTWSSVLDQVAAFATVVAYDRAGIGGSEADAQAPTPQHVARKLRALLQTIGASRRTCSSAIRGAAC